MTIKMYGTKYCGDCIRARQYFADHNVAYEDFDIEEHPEFIKIISDLNKGKMITPTIIISYDDGSEKVLSEPSNEDLEKALA